MNATSKIEAASPNVYQRLNVARGQFHATQLRKTGKNTFANYSYFELGDFLIPALKIFDEAGLCGVVSFSDSYAMMHIVNLDDPTDRIIIESPMGSAALKGCHEVQNVGAVETYQRRYLWATALEIVEHDALDASEGPAAARGQSQGGTVSPSQRINDAEWAQAVQLIEATKTDAQKVCEAHKIGSLKEMTSEQFAALRPILETRLAKMAKETVNA